MIYIQQIQVKTSFSSDGIAYSCIRRHDEHLPLPFRRDGMIKQAVRLEIGDPQAQVSQYTHTYIHILIEDCTNAAESTRST